jgi:hypothetical protein
MNENKPQPTAGSGPVAAMESRIDRIRHGVVAQQTRLNRGTRLTAIVGSALCVLMAIYFYIGYVKISGVMTPKSIVEAAETVIMDNLPSARRDLEEQIKDQADDWAATISTNIQENVPKVREQVEDFIMNKVGDATDQLEVLTATRFRTFVQQNRPMLADGFNSLKKPEDAERFLADLKSALEKEMVTDMREESEDMLQTILQLRRKLAMLKEGAGPSGKSLDSEQVLEREVLMIAKRLQVETGAEQPDDTPKKSKKKAAAKGPDSATIEEPAAKPAEKSAKPANQESKPAEEKKSGDN